MLFIVSNYVLPAIWCRLPTVWWEADIGGGGGLSKVLRLLFSDQLPREKIK